MPRSRRTGNHEQQLREQRDHAFEAPDRAAPIRFRPPLQGEWWELIDDTVHLVKRVAMDMRVPYVTPLCGDKPLMTRGEVPYDQLRTESGLIATACRPCWEDPRTLAVTIIRYAQECEFSSEEWDIALANLQSLS